MRLPLIYVLQAKVPAEQLWCHRAFAWAYFKTTELLCAAVAEKRPDLIVLTPGGWALQTELLSHMHKRICQNSLTTLADYDKLHKVLQELDVKTTDEDKSTLESSSSIPKLQATDTLLEVCKKLEQIIEHQRKNNVPHYEIFHNIKHLRNCINLVTSTEQ